MGTALVMLLTGWLRELPSPLRSLSIWQRDARRRCEGKAQNAENEDDENRGGGLPCGAVASMYSVNIVHPPRVQVKKAAAAIIPSADVTRQ